MTDIGYGECPHSADWCVHGTNCRLETCPHCGTVFHVLGTQWRDDDCSRCFPPPGGAR